MSSKTLLFRFGSKIQPITRFGEIDILSRACYFRGRELGYDKGNIFFEWPSNMQYQSICPKKTIIPIRFVKSSDIDESSYDKVINLTDSSIFYENSLSLYNDENPIERHHDAFLNYLNKYYIDYKKRPVYHIKQDELKEPYVLVHIRKLDYAITRNSDIPKYDSILKLLRERYNGYKTYGCGESSRFDKCFDYSLDFNKFLKLMNNSSLFIGCSSGPIQYAYCFDKPIIEIGIPKTINWSPIQNKYIGMGDYFSKKFWKYGLHGEYGDTIDYYMDKEKYLKLFAGDVVDKKKLMEFMNKWLI